MHYYITKDPTGDLFWWSERPYWNSEFQTWLAVEDAPYGNITHADGLYKDMPAGPAGLVTVEELTEGYTPVSQYSEKMQKILSGGDGR